MAVESTVGMFIKPLFSLLLSTLMANPIKCLRDHGLLPLLEALAFKKRLLGTWIAQSVEKLTPDFSSGHVLGVVSLNPALGSTLSQEFS